MDTDRFFLASDAALRGVIDDLRPDDLDTPAPREWSQRVEDPTLRDILFAHTYDEGADRETRILALTGYWPGPAASGL